MEFSDANMKQIHIKLNSLLHQALKLEAAYGEITIQELVVGLIEQRILQGEFSGMISNDG